MDRKKKSAGSAAGTQTMLRGLSVLECVADGINDVKGIAQALDTPRSNVTRMLTSLVSEGYLYQIPYRGYLLGPKLIHFGVCALAQRPVVSLAHPHLLELNEQTRDTTYLAIVDGIEALYLDKIPGQRGLEMRSQVGTHVPLASTGIGKSLMLSFPPEKWSDIHKQNSQYLSRLPDRPKPRTWHQFKAEILAGQERGWMIDNEEIEFGIRCVSAPVYDTTGEVIAAISVASMTAFMSEERMERLGEIVMEKARAISRDLGWEPAEEE